MTTFFRKELFIIAWIIGVELYWLYFIITLFCLMMFLSIVDIMLWYYIAHTKGVVSSRIGADGMMKKAIWIVLIGGSIFFLWNMSYVVHNETVQITLSMLMMIFVLFRVMFEFISLVENLALISSKQEKTTLQWISKILLKIVWIGQSQIEKKLERFTPQS